MTVHAASGHLALLHHSIHIPIGLLLQSNCVHRHWRQLSSCIRATWKKNQRSSICTIVIFLRSWISWFEHLQYFVFVASVVRAFATLLSYCIHVPSICKIVFFLHSWSEHLQDCFFVHIRCCLAYKGSYLPALGLLELRRVLTYDEHLLNDIV